MAKPLHRVKLPAETTRTVILKRNASFPVTTLAAATNTIPNTTNTTTRTKSTITTTTRVTTGRSSASDISVRYPCEPYFTSIRPRSRSCPRPGSKHFSENTLTEKLVPKIEKCHQQESEPMSPVCQLETLTPQQERTHEESEIAQYDAPKSLEDVRIRRDSFSSELSVKLTWVPLAPLGPAAAFHSCAFIGDTVYVHGGIKQASSSPKPSKEFFKIKLTTLLWENIATQGSPALSHHASVVIDDRYFMLIGGWDGKKRHAGISVYDTVEGQWMRMICKGFPTGAGLSSHTATLTSSGDILVIGREGSLHTQRRHGNMYILRGNIASGQFVYTPFTNNVISRSGHTANLIGNNLYILGGRSDHLLEKYVGMKSKTQATCTLLDEIRRAVLSSRLSQMTKLPCGRKHHISAANSNSILMHGGETFDGKAHEPVGEMYLICLKPSTKFYKLNSSGLCRSGHACIVLPDRILLHGGQSGKNEIHSGLYELVLE